MLTRSKTKREREASAPVRMDSKDVGHGISWLKIRTPNGKKRKSNSRWQTYERQGQELLPGITNEITLHLITPKLPWITFHTLLLVSSSWRQAIQSRPVYSARCRAHSTEALITVSPLRHMSLKDGEDERWIGLYSMRDEKVYRLPGIENSMGIPRACQCISLNGRVYVMGGLSFNCTAKRSMYVLDLVASKGWKRCASMKSARSGFGCCIIDGKIFVCGGGACVRERENTTRDTILLEPEVYDPELDLWSSLKSMTSLQVGNKVAVLGDEILIHSGYGKLRHKRWPSGCASFPEIYNPTLDEWRTVEDPMLRSDQLNSGKCPFITGGKIHSLDYTCALTKGKVRVQVYDLDKKSWSKTRKSLMFYASGFVTDLATPLVVDSEIVRLIRGEMLCGARLIHSSGFSVERKIRAWQTARTPFLIAYEPFLCPCMSIIRL